MRLAMEHRNRHTGRDSFVCLLKPSPMPVTETWVDANIVTLIGGIVFCLIGCKLADAVKFFRTAQVEEKDGV